MASPQNQHCATFVPYRWSWRNYVLGLSVRVRVRAYIRSLRACWCGGILRPACCRLLVLNCAMKYQYYVLSWVQWYLQCLGTQGNGLPAPLIIGKWRFWTSKFVKMHRNFYLFINLIINKIIEKKRKANVASNIHSHQHLIGRALMAGGPRWNLRVHAENGVPSPQIFYFNHCLGLNVCIGPNLHRTYFRSISCCRKCTITVTMHSR